MEEKKKNMNKCAEGKEETGRRRKITAEELVVMSAIMHPKFEEYEQEINNIK
ncbi:MAG: hypothetical protein HUJ89_06095 [Bacteroidales bacterium]|nr:hypothetical protein [Bacteroidales bacterium]